MLVIRKVEAEDHEEVLDLLRTDFYPHEPCAVGLDLCPPGYRMPALEEDMVELLAQGHSFLAEEGGLVGVVICSLDISKDKPEDLEAADVPSTPGVYPHKFHQLERFFKDLKSDFGRRIQDPGLAQEPLLDIFILCTRRGSRQQGVGSLLVRRALEQAQQEGVRGACTMGLSVYSQKIFQRMDFLPQVEIEYETYKQDEKLVFDCESMGEHKKGTFFTFAM